jgi:transcriptional regulator with XRE-family HTH domain
MIGTPPVRRRVLGAALRRYRENLGYSLEDAARVLECDRSKISRIETGHRGARPRELRDLLAEYGVDEPEQRTLAAIADPRAARGWWQDYADVLPQALRDYLVIEAAASRVLVYDNQQVPGLLQTEQYAHAIVCADPVVPASLRARVVEAGLIRQRVILAREHLSLTVVIGEGALRQAVGGGEVMRGQAGHLAAVSAASTALTVQVLPFTSGAHAAAGTGPVTVLLLAQAPGLGVVHLAGLSGGVFLESQADVAGYSRMLTRLQASALTAETSARLLREMAEPKPRGRIPAGVAAGSGTVTGQQDT